MGTIARRPSTQCMKVFLSYQHADTPYAAHALFRTLQAEGCQVFLDDDGIEPI
jgi:hypothetical protein